jgi:hypothetical protein
LGSKFKSYARSQAALGDLTAATGWQVHSVRAALTGLRKEGKELKSRSMHHRCAAVVFTSGTSRAAIRSSIVSRVIERIVLAGIGELISNPGRVAEALGPFVETAGEQQQLLRRACEVAAAWSELPAAQLRPAIAMLCQRGNLHSERIDIEISRRGLYAFLRDAPARDLRQAGSEADQAARSRASLQGEASRQPRHSHRRLATQEKLSPSYVALLLRLTFLAPDITRAILDGRQPSGFTAQKLVTYSGLPLGWPEQRQALGFA